MKMERGFRAKLDDYLNTAHPLQAESVQTAQLFMIPAVSV